MIICQAANRREVQLFLLDCFLWVLIHVRKRNIRGSHKTIHLQMDAGGVRTFVFETKYVHACGNYASESSLSLSPFCPCFASVYGHNLLCVCVQSHAQWPHLLSLSSDVYLEQCSSEIKGQKRRVVCSFISAPSDGGWQFLQLTPPDAFAAVGMCAVYACVCVCVLPHLGPPALPDLSDSDILFAAYCEPSISSSRTAVKRKDFNIFLLFFESFVLISLLIYGGN